MLSKLLSMKKADLSAKVQSIDASGVKSRGLRRRFERIRNKQGGFTLLELLVVVAILAAIAGTATLMLQDTDRRAAAGAHVAMMDQLSKGIQTFRVLNGNDYPNVWDSMLTNATNTITGATPTVLLSPDLYDGGTLGTLGGGSIALGTLSADEVEKLEEAGITKVRVLDPAAQGGACANDDAIKKLISSKANDVTAQTIFRHAKANGCGYGTGVAGDHADLVDGGAAFFWNGDPQRVGAPVDTTIGAAGSGNLRLVAFGVGPDSSLFDPQRIGALTHAPVYRHVNADEYNRFIVLFNVSDTEGVATFYGIIDGAGDTKDEELGELDGTRST